MSNRLLIIIALVLAASLGTIGLYSVKHHADDDNANSEDVSSKQAPNGGRTLEEAREQVKTRIAHFEKMTQEQWDQEMKTHPRRHGTLAEATEHAKQRLTQLNNMTEAQWDAQQNGGNRQTKPRTNTQLPNLGPKRNRMQQGAGAQQEKEE